MGESRTRLEDHAAAAIERSIVLEDDIDEIGRGLLKRESSAGASGADTAAAGRLACEASTTVAPDPDTPRSVIDLALPAMMGASR
jgi:hypothetical protein